MAAQVLPWSLAALGAGTSAYFANQLGYFNGLVGDRTSLAKVSVTASSAGHRDAVAEAPRLAQDITPISKAGDYGAVRAAVSDLLESNEKYDDGNFGPVLVRLAWHASGSYDKGALAAVCRRPGLLARLAAVQPALAGLAGSRGCLLTPLSPAASNTGGSNGATMRFNPERGHGANAGLHVAQDLLEPVKKQFPWLTYADLWTLAGCQAIEDMGGGALLIHLAWQTPLSLPPARRAASASVC